MLLRCQECGHENQLGAIFCRECGAKLDVEKMRPKVDVKKSGMPTGEKIKEIIAIISLIVIFSILGTILYPDTIPNSTLTADEKTAVDNSYKSMMEKIEGYAGRDSKYIFTPEAATYIYNNKIIDPKGKNTLTNTTISVTPSDRIYIRAKASFLGIPITYTLGGVLNEDFTMTTTEVKIGHLPVPGFAQNHIITKFSPIMEQSEIIKKIKSNTQTLMIENGDFVLQLKEVKNNIKKKKK